MLQNYQFERDTTIYRRPSYKANEQYAKVKLLWTYKTSKPIIACSLIRDGKIYIGSSEGHFRALSLLTSNLQWNFNRVKGFIVCRPLFYQGNLYFGSRGNEFYALNSKDGQLVWKWSNGAINRMFSPASCIPVATKGKVFIVAPDRYMIILDASDGNLLGRKCWDSSWVTYSEYIRYLIV